MVGRMGPGVEGGGKVLERGLGWDRGWSKVVPAGGWKQVPGLGLLGGVGWLG